MYCPKRIVTCLLGAMVFWGCGSRKSSSPLNDDGSETKPVTDTTSSDDKDEASDTDGDTDGSGVRQEDENTRKTTSLKDLQKSVTGRIPSNPNAPAPMPIISRGVPVFTSSGISRFVNDDAYRTNWISNEIPAWVTYDLSKIPKKSRGQVLVHWINDSYSYFTPTGTLSRCPRLYRIDAHAAPGGGPPPQPDDSEWQTLVDVSTPFIHHSRQHVVNMTDGETVYNWIRMYITEVNGTNPKVSLNVDVHDAHLGVEDSWFFTGDSLTAGAMRLLEWDDQNFAQMINEKLEAYWPVQENAGVGGWTSEDGARHIPGWLDHFPGRYVVISFGGNDAGGGMPPQDFYKNYEIIVKAVIEKGKIPVVPTVAWYRTPRNRHMPALNQKLAELKKAYPQIVNGPDVYTFFRDNPHLISDDNIHPTAPEGALAFRRLWAETMISAVYGL